MLYSYILNNICIPEQPTLIGRLELIFKKVFFRLYDSTYSELLEWSKQVSYPQHRLDRIMRQKIHEFIMRKIVEFIGEVEQIDSIFADDLIQDMTTVFEADIMGYNLSLKEFRLHEERGRLRTTRPIHAFNRLIKYAGYSGLLILIDEMEQDRNLNTFDTIYFLSNSENCADTDLKVIIAGTSDLIEDPTLGVRRLKKELYELLEKSRISIIVPRKTLSIIPSHSLL